MRHPDKVWSDRTYAEEPLDRLIKEYLEYLRGRAQRVSAATVQNYRAGLLSFYRSLERNREPTVLGSVTPHAVDRWVTERRAEGRAEEGIASALSALKVFTRKFVWQHLDLTTADLLAKVPRVAPPEQPMPSLSEEEIERILACFDRGNFKDTRDRALVGVFLSTGLRFRSVVEEMTRSGLDPVSGEFAVEIKGGRTQLCRLSPRALKLVKTYLQLRGNPSTDQLWVTDEGAPLGYWGAQSVFRRLKRRSGLPHVHAHLFRHTFAQTALKKGAPRAEVQDMLGHRTDAMTRRYTGTAREQAAARNMARYGAL
ncbi:MAG TPA: tyrosine-type recombinase/integrase [Chloroflexota bacterium]